MLRRTLFLYGLMCSLPFTVQAQHVNLLSSKALQAPQGKLDNQLFRVARAWAYGSVEASRVFGKYSALPGDMGNASAFWPGAKNGDSNGKVEGDESLNALQHLVNAGLIHSFTGERPIMGFAIGEKG